MPKLMYLAIFISLTTLLACSGPEKSPSPTAVAQNQALAPAAESIPAPTTAPVEIPAEDPVPVEDPVPAKDPVPAEDTAQAESPIPAGDPTTSLVEVPAQTDAPPETLSPINMKDPKAFMPELSGNEQSCLSENGDPQQLLMLVNRPDLASPEEMDALAGCLEHETLLNIFLKGFTDQAGPMSNDTSACVSAGFQNLDLQAMMLTDPEGPDGEAGAVQVMAGLIIVLACLDEPEWQAASQTLDLAPEGREAMQCVMNMLGGPEGIAASLESKEGEPPLALFSAVAKCGLTIMGGPLG